MVGLGWVAMACKAADAKQTEAGASFIGWPEFRPLGRRVAETGCYPSSREYWRLFDRAEKVLGFYNRESGVV